MADISTETQAILNAVYGEEVRSSIVNALDKMNEQAESAETWATGAGTEEPGGGDVPGTENNAKYYADTAATVLGQIPSDFANTATFAAGIMGKSDPITYTIITKKGIRPNDGTPEITSSASVDIAVVPVEPGKTYLFSQGLKAPSLYGAGWMASVHTLSTFDAADCVGVFFNSSASAADPHIFTAPETRITAGIQSCWQTFRRSRSARYMSARPHCRRIMPRQMQHCRRRCSGRATAWKTRSCRTVRTSRQMRRQ